MAAATTRPFRDSVRRNLALATLATTVMFLGASPIDLLTLVTPEAVDIAIEDALDVAFLCSPVMFLAAIALPVLRSTRGPVVRRGITALVPRWLLALCTACVLIALPAPIVYGNAFVAETEMRDLVAPYTGTAWIVYGCFVAGSALVAVTLAECLGRAELDPADEPRTRQRIATRAVTALVPLAASSAAIAALLIGDAGWRYRVAADGGGTAPAEWSFAASPVTGTAVIAFLAVVAVILIGALVVFHSPPKPRGRPVEEA